MTPTDAPTIPAQGADTSSEAWRHACEVRYVCDLPTLAARREYLEAVARRRSPLAVERLRSDVAAEWGRRREGMGLEASD